MFIIYGKQECPNCDVAKDLIVAAGQKYSYLDVFNPPQNLEDLTEALGYRPRSVPQVFFEGKYVGQVKELKTLLTSLKGESNE